MLAIKDETFDGSFPFPLQYCASSGFAMHYVDVGSGEPIVMLHCNPTWRYLYRHFIPALAQKYRCIVPDHMGMGTSDVPQDRSLYCLEHHVANLEGLLMHLDVHDITLVLHDWGGPVGLEAATRHPERIKRTVLMNTWAFAPWPGGPFPCPLDLIRSQRGEAVVRTKNGYLEPALMGATYHTEQLTKTVMSAYRAPFPMPESRLAMLCWSRDSPPQQTNTSYAEMHRIEQSVSRFGQTPSLLIWGMRDPVPSPAVLRHWQGPYPHAQTHEREDASHFLQEDAPEQIVERIVAFLSPTP